MSFLNLKMVYDLHDLLCGTIKIKSLAETLTCRPSVTC